MQIRARLTIQYIVTVAAILLLTLMYIYLRYAHSMEDEFYRGLRSKAVMTVEMVLREEDKLQFSDERDNVSRGEKMPVSEVISIYNSQRRCIFAINPPEEPPSAAAFDNIEAQGERRFRYANLSALGLRHESRTGNQYVIVAGSIYRNDELKKLRGILTASFLVAIGLVALAGWFFAGRAMTPVAEVVNEVGQLLPSHLGTRLKAPETNDEIGRLVATFNQMLDRIYFAFQMQKRFISNVSHELKNPVSVIISQLEVALEDEQASKEEYRDTLQSVLEDSRGMALMTERLLQMARVYSEDSNIAFSPIRLDEVVLQAREALLRAKPNYSVAFDVEGEVESEDALTVTGNEALLRLALMNLMENGCKFSAEHQVSVYLRPQTHHALILEVRDKGAGIPGQDLGLIFQPFYRGTQQAKTPGSGIGLSLVDSILRLHHVGIKVESIIGQGTTFHLEFPILRNLQNKHTH